jgi:hypothetical protein
MARLLFWILFFVYAVLYLLKTLGYYTPWISDYLADLLCLPIVLSIVLFAMRKMRVVPESFELTPAMILAALIYFSIVFEWLLPLWSDRYQSDFLDIVAYSLGAIAYYYFRKHHNQNQYETV